MTDIREAAKRLIALSTNRAYGEPTVEDVYAVASEWLEEHPEDDDLPVTESWMEEHFRPWRASRKRYGWELSAVVIVRLSDQGFFPVFSHTGEGASGAQLKARGDVRRLCRVLGSSCADNFSRSQTILPENRDSR